MNNAIPPNDFSQIFSVKIIIEITIKNKMAHVKSLLL